MNLKMVDGCLYINEVIVAVGEKEIAKLVKFILKQHGWSDKDIRETLGM